MIRIEAHRRYGAEISKEVQFDNVANKIGSKAVNP